MENLILGNTSFFFGIRVHKWNAAKNLNDYIASLFADTEQEQNKLKFHRLHTNSYRGKKVNIDEPPEEAQFTREKLDEKSIKMNDLKAILKNIINEQLAKK